MADSIDPAERKKAMTMLEQYVTVSMQDERIDEAELMDRLRMFNAMLKPRCFRSQTLRRSLAALPNGSRSTWISAP